MGREKDERVKKYEQENRRYGRWEPPPSDKGPMTPMVFKIDKMKMKDRPNDIARANFIT